MYQQLTIVGNLGKDPDARFLPDGRPATTLNVATNRQWKNGDGETKKETTWFRVSVFGKAAEACAQYLTKGRPVLVVGTLRSDPKTGGPKVFTKQDGSMGASFEVFAETVKFLGGGNGEHVERAVAGDEPAEGEATEAAGSDDSQDGFPF